jgi:hypothetical protein
VSDVAVNLRAKAVLGNVLVLDPVHASVALVVVPDQGRDHASASVARGDVLVAVPGRDRESAARGDVPDQDRASVARGDVLVAVPGRDRVDADLVADLDRASVARGNDRGLADEN